MQHTDPESPRGLHGPRSRTRSGRVAALTAGSAAVVIVITALVVLLNGLYGSQESARHGPGVPEPGPRASSHSATQSSPSSPVSSNADSAPVLTMGFQPVGEAAYYPAADQQDLYVYPDGSALRLRLSGSHADNERSLEFEWLRLGPRELEDAKAAARFAGLVGGGAQPTLPVPAGVQVQGGSVARFTARLDDEVTVRSVEQLLASTASNLEGERAKFRALADILHPVLNGLPSETSSVDRWVVISTPVPEAEPDDMSTVWTGPEPDELRWTEIGNGARCAIVGVVGWSFQRAERQEPRVVLDRRQLSRRPLLPHESTCDDVAEWRELLAISSVGP